MRTTDELITRRVFSAFVIIAVSICCGCGSDSGRRYPHALVTPGTIETMVRTVGMLEAVNATVISSEISGDKSKIAYLIEDGAQVVAGDLLLHFDPAPFEEHIRVLLADVADESAKVEAAEQNEKWEAAKGKRDLQEAETQVIMDENALEKLKQGEGPLEIARFEGEMQKASREYEQKKSYATALEELRARGYINAAEIQRAEQRVEESHQVFENCLRQYDVYRNVIFPALLSAAETKVENARLHVEYVQQDSTFRKTKARQELANARRRLADAQSRLEAARQEMARTRIAAPIPGMVVISERYQNHQKAKLRVGDTVWQHQPLIFLPDISEMRVVSRIREIDLHKIEKNNPAVITVDAYPEARFSGHIERIGVLAEQVGNERGGEKYFQIAIRIEGSDSRLRPGMTARIEIPGRRKEEILRVPLAAVFIEQGRSFCFVYKGQEYVKRGVTTGIADSGYVEICEGLAEGDAVALFRPELYSTNSGGLE